MVRPEYRTYDDNRLLKNEINRLSQDNEKLRKLLQDLNSSIAEENLRATKPKGWVSFKCNITWFSCIIYQ